MIWSEIKIQAQYRILYRLYLYRYTYGVRSILPTPKTNKNKTLHRSEANRRSASASWSQCADPSEISIYFIHVPWRNGVFVCGCELRVVHVGKENKIPFLWCNDKDFYAFYFKSKLNHFLLKFSSFHFASVYCVDRYRIGKCEFGRFSRARKTSKLALLADDVTCDAMYDSAYNLIECGPGIRANWACEKMTSEP